MGAIARPLEREDFLFKINNPNFSGKIGERIKYPVNLSGKGLDTNSYFFDFVNGGWLIVDDGKTFSAIKTMFALNEDGIIIVKCFELAASLNYCKYFTTEDRLFYHIENVNRFLRAGPQPIESEVIKIQLRKYLISLNKSL